MKFKFLIILMIILTSCSRQSDTELYNEAKTSQANKDFQKTEQLFTEIVDRFQTSAYAESSLIHLSFLYNNELKDARKAIHTYKRYCELFPNTKQTPTMLFLTGFVYNNELHLLDSARLSYESFLQKYPTHELATSAKFELETLGKDPGLVLNKQTVATEDGKANQSKKAGTK